APRSAPRAPSDRQFAPDRRVIGGAILAARALVDVTGGDAVGGLRRQQEVIDAQSLVAVPAAGLVIPERVFVQLPMKHAISVGQIQRSDPHLVARTAGERAFDITRLLVVEPRKAGDNIARRLLRDERDAVIGALPDAFDAIAERLHFEPREIVSESFDFLQAQ